MVGVEDPLPPRSSARIPVDIHLFGRFDDVLWEYSLPIQRANTGDPAPCSGPTFRASQPRHVDMAMLSVEVFEPCESLEVSADFSLPRDGGFGFGSRYGGVNLTPISSAAATCVSVSFPERNLTRRLETQRPTLQSSHTSSALGFA